MTRFYLPFLISGLFLGVTIGGTTNHREGLFNTTSYINLLSPITLNKHIGLSFRSCIGGQLFTQRSAKYTITLEVRTEGLFFTVTIANKRFETRISANLLDNEWHTVNILYRLGNLTISTSGHQQTISNSTFSSEILTQPELTTDKDVLVVGSGFDGCILEGPSIVFKGVPNLHDHNVEWGPCPLPTTSCGVVDHCANEPCMMHGRCISLSDRYLCQCTPRYTGNNCQIDHGSPCDRHPCKNGGSCKEDKTGDFECICPPGFAGKDCDVPIVSHVCDNNSPCRNNATCIPAGSNDYKCKCEPGFEGKDCEININECLSSPCQHGGTCIDGINSFSCICSRTGYTGARCEININECENNPCLNNGICFDNYGGYTCQCAVGFGGQNCEQKLSECASSPCTIPNSVCVETNMSYKCDCKPGFAGIPPNCTQKDICLREPCSNGATCRTTADGGFICICPPGFTGKHCELDINECDLAPRICNNGICVNNEGGYQCFCTPGFSGDHCEIDFDECLSHPCRNGATCENKINKFNCVCLPGYTGIDCSEDIDECLSNPCVNGSSCINEVATFSCVCPPGLTGRFCEKDIDDCESSPCQNGGRCIDGLNSYTCDCTETGYEGIHCEQNIDECISNPCMNGAKCRDLVKGYACDCYPGYNGVNCEIDINECLNNPCLHNGTCIQKSDRTRYVLDPAFDPSHKITFNKTFDYANASGYECICINGITGVNCEININECESSPCNHGSCVDGIASYTCECEEGFEGTFCETDIDECIRYKPCVNGTCIDKVAGYFCECDGKYGGKNCSVELTGCVENPCQNNGTCKPYLENETIHRFNCSCTNGYHGSTCEKVTTMSLNGSSYVMVNTTREEGYDIQFRFKTTLGKGLLAIGKGSTFYILELVNGRLNLHSSLLNKWEGVFIGSNLNDSNWQKVFVAINSSHLVLAANEEQTIYPINLNEGANASHTSFPTTYLGGAISYFRRLAHGPSAFVGCVQDVQINGQWVLPQDSGIQPISFVGVEVGCKREEQCKPNPCHSGGHCSDLWSNFSCECARPFLGKTCQYNYSAATFGHENITDSLVQVFVDNAARRAVRSIMDISMFIRTREPSGGIFYLGSKPGSTLYNDETIIAAKLVGGELKVSFQFNGNIESYGVDGVRLDNGFNHLIQVVRNVTLVQVKINGTEYFRKTISATGQLDLQFLQLGGILGNNSNVRNFKGVIQDVEMSNGSRSMAVEFFPLTGLTASDLIIPFKLGQVSFNDSLVLEGIVSDDSCISDPCMHGGTCTVTWNDFSCACTVGHKGKQCQEMEFCQVQDCPIGSECRNLNHGYECVANITIHEPNEMGPGLRYKLVHGEQSVGLTEVTFAYRSKTGGNILQVGPDANGNFLTAYVFNDEVTVSWNMKGLEDVKKISKDPRDGEWSTVWLKILDNTITGGLTGASEDTPQYFSSNFSQSTWEVLVSSSFIMIGGVAHSSDDRHSYVTGEGIQTNAVEFVHSDSPLNRFGGVYKGCIGEVRFGGLLLPYFTPQELNATNSSLKDHFELLPGSTIGQDLGCALCFINECYNGGKCKDPSLYYTCVCEAGFTGDDCSKNIDECNDNDCKNNSTCIDGLATYTCQCQPGWQGSLCDIEIDECASSPCLNNGTCIDRLATFLCVCPDEFVGFQCEQLKLITCDNNPCKNQAECQDVINPETNDNFTCICSEGFLGDRCEDAFCDATPCENNGVCLKNSKKPVCECMAGYIGKFCEINIDECESSPCEHGGRCEDLIASFKCHCEATGYNGTTCNMDINECEVNKELCVQNGHCINTIGSYHCACNQNYCGENCTLNDPCTMPGVLCANGGTCVPECDEKPDYRCECINSYTGKNCTELLQFGVSRVADIALIVVPILAILIIAGLISLSVFLMMARKKRATRGTYSPSSQEYCNPRVELDNVMKPPPEERLI